MPNRIQYPRTRTRTVPMTYVLETNGNIVFEGGPLKRVTDTMVDLKIRPSPLRRVYQDPNVIRQVTLNGTNAATYHNTVGSYIDPAATWYLVEPYLNRLNVKKLPTSNKADLLTNMAELDDTILMFSKNIKKSASYGGYKWGWAPLVDDIMACNDAANAVKNSVLHENGRRTSRYRTNQGFTVKSPIITSAEGMQVRHIWDVSVKFSGEIAYDNNVLAFYDYMGFHPSPKLIWDLVPLSFALDYILPIGDMLKSITPEKGWVKSANFTGWRVVKAMCTEQVVKVRPDYSVMSPYSPIRFVQRDLLNGVCLDQKRIHKEIEVLKLPTFEQAFDLSYLAETFYQRGRKLLSPHVYKKRK